MTIPDHIQKRHFEQLNKLLKPCPYCGYKAPYVIPTYVYAVICPQCGMNGPSFSNSVNTARAWNELPRSAKP